MNQILDRFFEWVEDKLDELRNIVKKNFYYEDVEEEKEEESLSLLPLNDSVGSEALLSLDGEKEPLEKTEKSLLLPATTYP